MTSQYWLRSIGIFATGDSWDGDQDGPNAVGNIAGSRVGDGNRRMCIAERSRRCTENRQMLTKRLFSVFSALVLTIVAGPGNAVPLQDLFEGETIIVDDKLFFGWTLLNLVVTDPALDPNLALIEVLPLEDQPQNPGLRFEANGQLMVTDQNFIDLHFGFLVAALDPNHLIKDNSLELVGFAFGGVGGLITIIEEVFDATGNQLADKLVLADQLLGIFNLFDSAAFPPQALILVEKNILLAGDFSADLVSLDVFEQRFSQVPPQVPGPASLLLVVLGLAVTAFGRRLHVRWPRARHGPQPGP
jgi:hypothetical protein